MSALPIEAPSHLQEVLEKTQHSKEQIRKVSLDVLYRRYRGICWICRKFCPRDKASRDHIFPKSLGGTDDIKNLALAHKLCNSKRGNGYNEIFFKHYDDLDKDVVVLEEYGIMLHFLPREDGVSLILSKKRDDWENGRYV